MPGKALQTANQSLKQGNADKTIFKASIVRKKGAEFGAVTVMIMNSGCRICSFTRGSVAFECSGVLIEGYQLAEETRRFIRKGAPQTVPLGSVMQRPVERLDGNIFDISSWGWSGDTLPKERGGPKA